MNTQSPPGLPYISEAEIAQVLEWQPLIETLEQAMIAFSADEVEQPVRQMVSVPGENAIMDVAAAKLAYDLITQSSAH